MANEVTLRLATTDDAASIKAIYNHEVTTSTSTFDLVPRTLVTQRDWLAARSGAFAVVVAVDQPDGSVIGFGSISPYKERAAYRTTVEDSVYVRRDRQRAGVGRLLLGEFVAVASAHGVRARVVTDGGSAVAEALAAGGVHVLVARTDRVANVEVHARLNAAVARAVRGSDKGR